LEIGFAAVFRDKLEKSVSYFARPGIFSARSGGRKCGRMPRGMLGRIVGEVLWPESWAIDHIDDI
jgi:hypothetical protein